MSTPTNSSSQNRAATTAGSFQQQLSSGAAAALPPIVSQHYQVSMQNFATATTACDAVGLSGIYNYVSFFPLR